MYEDNNLIYKTQVTTEICMKNLNVCKGKTSQLFLSATQTLSFRKPKAILLNRPRGPALSSQKARSGQCKGLGPRGSTTICRISTRTAPQATLKVKK